jgi:hypothetical protein
MTTFWADIPIVKILKNLPFGSYLGLLKGI